MKLPFFLSLAGVALNGFGFSAIAFADNYTVLPFVPRVSVDGLVGNQDLVSGDMMAPIYGNSDAIAFFDVQGKTAFDNPSMLSLGGGFRKVQQEQRILGAYIFADRSVSSQSNAFWFISPGLESMGRIWDLRVNGYFPTGSQHVAAGSGFADEFNNYNYVTFNGHDQLDVLVNNFEAVGWGVDGEIGRRIPGMRTIRVYVGGYHFNINDASDINGVAGRLELPINRLFSFSLRDSYDNNQHNTIEAALTLTLGGVNTVPQDPNQPIEQRLLDPVSRNLATLGQGNGEPIVSEQEVISSEIVERSDIWFFNPYASNTFVNSNSCTAENPCSSASFNQNTIDSINSSSPNSNAAFYFSPGAYSALTDGDPDVLTNDSLYSRTADYTAPQRGAIFSGAFIINGVSDLNAITLYNSTDFVQSTGLTLNSGAQVVLDNSVIGSANNNQAQSYPTAIKMTDSNLTVTNHAEVYAFSNNATPAVAIETQDSTGSTISLNNYCMVSASVMGLSSTVDYSALGIAATSQTGAVNNTAKINIGNGCIVRANAIGNFGIFNIAGIYEAEQTNQLTISGNSTVSAAANVAYGPTISVAGVEMAGSVNNLQISNSQISAHITTGSQYLQTTLSAIGIDVAGNNNTISLNSNSQVNSGLNTPHAQQALVEGIEVDDQGAGTTTVTINRSQVNVNAMVQDLISYDPYYSVITQGVYIDTSDVTSGFTNTVNLINHGALTVDNSVVNADLAIGYANQILSEGIVIDSAMGTPATNNLNNTVTVDNSSIDATAMMTNGGVNDPNLVAATGIDLNSGDNSMQTVNMSHSANVQAQAILENGGNNNDTASATSVNMNIGNTSSNTLSLQYSSTMQANATIVNGGDLNNQVIASGMNVAGEDNSTNQVTVGVAGDAADRSSIIANATIQNGGGDTYGNATNSTSVYGINVCDTGCSATNTIIVQGSSMINVTADIQNGGIGPSTNSSLAYGIHVCADQACSATNTIILQGASIIDVTADIVNGGLDAGSTNSATSTGVYVKGADNNTTLKDQNSITASSSANGSAFSVTATGIESVAPSSTNIVDNQVDPTSNSNIQALENDVDSGVLINQHD